MVISYDNGLKIRAYVNSKVSVCYLLRRFFGIEVGVGDKFCCPFHDDMVCSAKVYEDSRFFCFACYKQYDSYEVLKRMGLLSDFLSGVDMVEVDKVRVDVGGRGDLVELRGKVERLRRKFGEDCDFLYVFRFWDSAVKEVKL